MKDITNITYSFLFDVILCVIGNEKEMIAHFSYAHTLYRSMHVCSEAEVMERLLVHVKYYLDSLSL